MELDEFCVMYALMVAAVVDRTDGKCGDLMDGELSGLVDHWMTTDTRVFTKSGGKDAVPLGRHMRAGKD